MTDYYDQLDQYQESLQQRDWSGTSGSAGPRHPGRSLDDFFGRLKQYHPSPDYRAAEVAAEAPINPLYRPVGGAAQSAFQPAGPPQRYSANLLGDVVAGAADSAPGQFFLGQPGAQRGGVMDVNPGFGPHFGLATAPVTFANFATYAREGALSAITSALGHHYQQGDNGAAPEGPVNNRDILGNIGQGDLPGVLDNVIDGLTTVGDAVNAPFVAFGDFLRDNAAHSRGEAVRDLVRSGGTIGDPISRISSLFDQSRFGWDSIIRKAQERGISTTAMAAELWDLDPAIVERIQQNPNMKDDELYKLVKGQPFSYNPGVNILAELAVLGIPMLAGGWALQGARGAITGIRLARLLGEGRSLESLGLFGRTVATAEKIGSWSMPKAWRNTLRIAGAVTGVTPTGFKIGAGIRFGEWAFKQIAATAGNEEAVRAADEWLWEMPLSNNPGLMMVDAFRVHPLHEAKALRGRVTAIGRKLFGSDEAVPSSHIFTKAMAPVAAMDLPTLQTRMLDKLGWDEAWAQRFFGEDGPQSLNDLKNGLYHVALQVVRDDHELRSKYLAPGKGIIERARAFEEAYGEEAAQLLRNEVSGHGTRIVDALKTEYWDRANIIDASDLGQEPAIGPYDPAISFTRFGAWVRTSKLFSGIAEDAVPKLNPEVNAEFIKAYRTRLLESYPDPKSLVSARDLNLLQTYVPMTAKLEGSPTRGRRAVGKVNRATVERLLAQAEHVQGGTDLVRAQPRTEAMPALAPLEADNLAAVGKAFKLRADTIDAIQRGMTDGPDALGPVPADLSAVLTKVYGTTDAEIKRLPAQSWQRAFDWYGRMYDSAIMRGQAIDTVARFEKIIEDRFAATEDAGLDHEAFNRLRSALTHPYAETELAQTPALRPIAAERDAALAEFVDGMSKWLDSPLRHLHVRQLGDVVVLETDNFKASDVAVIDYLANLARDTDLRPEQLALLDDPAAHPLEMVPPIKAALDNGMDAAAPAIARLNDLGTLEGEFRPLFEQAYGPGHDPVTRETVMRLTDEVASHADELTSLRDQVRSLGGLIDRSPASTIADDTREFYDRAATLGGTRPNLDVTRKISKAGKKAPKPAIPNWRALQLEPQGIKLASNERQLGQMRSTLDRTIADRQAVLDTYDEAVKRYTTRAAEKLTVDDYAWSEPVFSERTLSAARDQAKGLMEGGIPALVEKVGAKRWVVRRGELRAERAVPPEAAPVAGAPQPAVEPPSAPQPAEVAPAAPPPIVERVRADEKARAALEERWLADQATKSQAYTAHGEAYRAALVESGAPIEAPFLDPLDNRTPVPARVVLVDANDLLTSDQIGFPANLQPRSRSIRTSSSEQVQSYARDIQPDKLVGVTEGAQGMPVVNAEGAVVAGNGRTMALRIADQAQFGRYRVRIQAEAGKYGIPIEAVNAMDRPMLVRELVGVDPVTTERLAWQLNEMPVADLAPSLAGAITREDIRALQVGDEQSLEAALKSGTNDAAIGRMLGRLPADARARYRAADGSLNEQGVRLLEGALLSKLLRADDRTLPGYEAARNVVFDVVDRGGEEMRRITNALAESAGQILKVQEQAETGLLGKEILEFSDDLTPALGRILELRQTGLSMDGVGQALDNTTAFDEFTLTPVQTQLAKLLAESSSQREVREFLRGVAEAGGNLGAQGMELFAEQRPDYTGLLNSGLRAWNEIRRERGLPQSDPFPSTEPPYDIPLTGARKSVTGADLPPVVQSQPLAAEELAGEIAARTAGEPVHGIVEQVETTPAGARTVHSTDPNEQAYIEAVTTDARAVRAEIDDTLDTLDGFKGTGPRRDFYNALLESANDGTIGPGEWAVLKGLAGGLIRRNKAGKLNMAPVRRVLDREGLLAAADADARQLAGKGTVPFDDAASVVSPHVQHPISPEELAADVGPEVPHAPDVALADEIAGRTDHIVVSNENPTLSAALRRKVGAPDVRDAKRRVIELNAPEATKAIENLSRLRAQALAGVEQARHARTEFDMNPPIPPEVEQPSVFATPELGGMWDRLMRSGHDQLAAAIGSQEPRSLGELLDAVESIDKGFITDPSTGVGLTMNEAAELKSELMTLANAQLGVALERSGARRQSAALRSLGKPPPDDFDLEGLQERSRAIMDEVGQMITVDDPALPPMAGFMGVQYVPSRPPTRSRVAPGEPLTPRILWRDRFADDIIPTLNEELATGRMEDFPRRVENARVVRLLDHLVGPRVEQDLRTQAIRNFADEIERFVDPTTAAPEEYARIGKVIDAAFTKWRQAIDESKQLGFPTIRRIHLMGPEKFNRIFAEAVDKVYDGAHPAWLDAMVGEGKQPHQLWRRADNRLRNYIRDSGTLGQGLERMYGSLADRGAKAGQGVSFVYNIVRFLGDVRWLGLEAVEPSLLALFRGGIRPLAEAGPLRGKLGEGKAPLAFGERLGQAMEDPAHWATLSDTAWGPTSRHRYLLRVLAQEQKTPFRDALIEMAQRDPHLGELVRQMGDTPQQFVERLDRDFSLADQRTRTFKTRAEAERFFRPWLDGGFIDQRTFDAYAQGRRYSPQPAIEEELARVVGDPTAEALYTKLAEINHGLMHDLSATFFGQADRSNVQRLLNHPLLYWPVSYQIKATKWLLNVMLDHAFGVDTGAAGGLVFQRVADEHKKRMLTDPTYAANVQANAQVYFLASMIMPITPWDIGVSLSPWTRMAIDPTYQRQFGVSGVGPFYTYGSLLPRLIAEQTKPGGLLAGTPLGERLGQAFPQSITITKRPTSTIDAENQRVAPPNAVPVPPYQPPVPRFP